MRAAFDGERRGSRATPTGRDSVDGRARGRHASPRFATFAYSADTAFDPQLVDWLSEADLFFHETNLGIHTPLASLAALPEATRARMRLIHYPDFHEVATSPIACAREGERFEI